MWNTGLIFAICMTRIVPILGRFYVLRDGKGGAYFFEESDLKSKDPTKSFYFLQPDNYSGSGELVTNVQKSDSDSEGYVSDTDDSSDNEDEQDKEVDSLSDDIYGILDNLKGLQLLAGKKAKKPKKPKFKLIPGDFQSKVKAPKYKQDSLEDAENTDESFLGLPTSHLTSIMKLLDDFALDRDAYQLAGRALPPNTPHVEINTGLPKNENVNAPKNDLVKKLEMLIKNAKKNTKNKTK